jgi:hypothetical protein
MSAPARRIGVLRPPARWPTLAWDLAICLAFTVAGVLLTLGEGGGNARTVVDSLVAPAATLPVLLWRRAPLAAAAALPVGVLVSAIPTFDQIRCGVAIPIALMVMFSAGVRLERDHALAALLAGTGAMAILLPTDVLLDESAIPVLLLPALGWVAGRAVRAQSALARQLAARGDELEARRAYVAGLAAEVERGRVSRDIQAAAHERVRELAAAARRADEAPSDGDLDGIEREGRAALNAMRDLLGALRSDASAPAPSLPTLSAPAGLAGHGSRVDVVVRGSPRELPGALDRAAGRAVEYLLGALRAAEDDRGTLRLEFAGDALTIDVDGPGASRDGVAVAVAAAGERLAAHGGSLRRDPAAPDRLTVRLRLPLAGASSA